MSLRRKTLLRRVLVPYHLAMGDNELLLVEQGASKLLHI